MDSARVLTNRQYNDCVAGPGSPRYDEAYFDINYVRTYTTTTAGVTSPTGTSGSASTVTTTVVTVPQTTGSSSGVGVRDKVVSLMTVVGLFVGTLFLTWSI